MRRLSAIRPLPFAGWPDKDRTLFDAARRPGDLLEPGGAAAHWRPRSVAWAIENYGYWLAWLAHESRLEPDATPADRCTPDRLRDYLRLMPAHLAPITVANRLVALKRVLAVTCPDADLDFLKATVRHLDARPSTDRRSRLRTADELSDFGIDLMEEADRSEAPHKRRALSYRNGFIIALLSRRPLRRCNLASLELGVSLVRMDDGWRIRFPGEEMKTHRPIDVPLPATLIPYLERYLDCHRPHLAPLGTVCRPDSGALFVSSRTGRAMSGHTINLTVGELIRQRFGKPMCLHMFREAAPTTLAIKAPEHVRIAAAIINHADYRTTERWYNLATMMDAANAHLDNLDALRKELRQ